MNNREYRMYRPCTFMLVYIVYVYTCTYVFMHVQPGSFSMFMDFRVLGHADRDSTRTRNTCVVMHHLWHTAAYEFLNENILSTD